jgi:hypothetical protein
MFYEDKDKTSDILLDKGIDRCRGEKNCQQARYYFPRTLIFLINWWLICYQFAQLYYIVIGMSG